MEQNQKTWRRVVPVTHRKSFLKYLLVKIVSAFFSDRAKKTSSILWSV